MLLINNYIKKTKLVKTILVLFVFSAQTIDAQQIIVDNSQSPEQLINALVDGCVEVSNISSPVNGSVNGFSSFGFFERGASNFPFQNGIVLTSGNVNAVGNTLNTSPLNEGDENWLTDPDLDTALGTTETLNATSIEFNFISATNSINFNYILASEEYYSHFPCEYSDGFAFLIKEAGTTMPFQNIAIIPGTNTPVNTSTIHEEIVGICDAENETFFEGYNIGDTNFNGRTTVMSASTSITPNVEYTIKLIIADNQNDVNFDSAVFIEANSFNNNIDLGDDFSTCDASAILNAQTNIPEATYEWFLNSNVITGETNNTLTATNSGTYSVLITVPLNASNCTFEDEIEIVLNDVQSFPELNNFTQCDDSSNDGIESFDLTTLNGEVEANLPASNYSISYHLTNQEAIDNINNQTVINNTTSPQTIHIRAIDINSGCINMSTVNLVVNPFPTIIEPEDLEVCSNTNGNIILSDNNADITNSNLNYIVTYHFSQIDADSGANAIPSPYTPTNATEQLFIRVMDITTGCQTFTNITINTTNSPNINSASQTLDACEQDDNGIEIFDLTAIINDVLNGLTNVSVSFHNSQEDANNNTNPIPDPTQFQNTILNIQTVYIRVNNNNNSCFEIVPIILHTNILETGTNIRDFTTCDEAPDDGMATFNLETITQDIANGLEDVIITYYETQTDFDNNTNALDNTIPYNVNNTQELFLLIENLDCTNDAQIQLIVNESVTILNNNPVTYCDTDDDALTSVELATFNNVVNVGIANPVVTYFETEIDAIDNTNILPTFYPNTINPFTLFVKVTNSETGCFDIKPLEIEVLPAPTINSPMDFVICDDDQDAMSVIDLTSRNAQINNEASTVISYFQP